ncbi:hypothetical protein chiPu_0022391 [Chiloscyllium punctatum]|uniref:Uncharacterized protein n=1 Tax=Chiloscyllium punctatum TaxID=137246 RepID=A0A401RDR3_CHIPU|nr:hypothetical protein [Chiloscyllium punctatum]
MKQANTSVRDATCGTVRLRSGEHDGSCSPAGPERSVHPSGRCKLHIPSCSAKRVNYRPTDAIVGKRGSKTGRLLKQDLLWAPMGGRPWNGYPIVKGWVTREPDADCSLLLPDPPWLLMGGDGGRNYISRHAPPNTPRRGGAREPDGGGVAVSFTPHAPWTPIEEKGGSGELQVPSCLADGRQRLEKRRRRRGRQIPATPRQKARREP